MPLETCFTTISHWLRTDQSALPASHKLACYFPQGPLDKDDGIDIVAVTDSSTLILPLILVFHSFQSLAVLENPDILFELPSEKVAYCINEGM